LKRLLPDYQRIEARVWCAIAARFNLNAVIAPEIKHADRIALMTERRDLMGPPVEPWYEELEVLADQLPTARIKPQRPCAAKGAFL
jgi:hypothetical protein